MKSLSSVISRELGTRVAELVLEAIVEKDLWLYRFSSDKGRGLAFVKWAGARVAGVKLDLHRSEES